MGAKLLWLGVTCILALPILLTGLPWVFFGSIVMVLGLILYLLDK